MDTQKRAIEVSHFKVPPLKEVSRFIILIPHRDSLKPLEEYRSRLFAAGFPGAYAFPAAAPLAAVSRPFSREELKELARNIRSLTAQANGKIQGERTALVQCGPFSFLGVLLDFPVGEALFPQAAREKIIAALSPALCAALVSPGEENRALEQAPPLSFRAASVANLAVRPLPCGDRSYSFEWNIGPLAWLPKNGGIILPRCSPACPAR